MSVENQEMWDTARRGLYADIWDGVQAAAAEIVGEHPVQCTERDDAVVEWADTLMPTYYSDIVQYWLALGMPDGLEEPEEGVFAYMTYAISEWFTNELWATVERESEKGVNGDAR